MATKTNSAKVTIFRNRPLVRSGNTIYYGNISDKCVIKIEASNEKIFSESAASDDITIQLLDTNPDLSPRKKLMKQCKRNGLYQALDIADAWLDKALSFDAN